MKALTTTSKKRITEDWRAIFPEMGVYKPMWLARRVGPFVHGICLDRTGGNDAYFPTSHLHNLCRESSSVSLALAQRVRNPKSGVQERISVQWHSGKFQEAARLLNQQSVLPLRNAFSVSDVLAAYKVYRTLRHPDSQYPVRYFEDAILLLAWNGQLDQAARLLGQCEEEINSWPPFVIGKLDGVKCWSTAISRQIQNSQDLKTRVGIQSEIFKLNPLPFYSLADD